MKIQMKELHSTTIMLLFLLIGLAFIGLGLTIGTYSLPEALNSSAVAGIPIPPPPP